MKTITTLAAVTALIGGMAVANAQNAPSPNKQEPSPAAINGGGTKTGAQAGSTSGEASKSGMSGSAMKSNMKAGKSASMKKKHRTTTGSGTGNGYEPENRGSPNASPNQ